MVASRILIWAFGCAAGIGLATLPAMSAPLYSVVDIGTLGGGRTYGYAINNSGSVAGKAVTPTIGRAVLYDGSTLLDLGVLSAPGGSTGIGINDSGQVVGTSQSAGGDVRAFLSSGGLMSDIGTLGGSFAEAYGINNSGVITGFAATTGDANVRGFIYSSGAMTDLGSLGPGRYSYGFAINSSGQVTGESAIASTGLPHAFLYSGGSMVDLGTLGGTQSRGRDINDSGVVVGRASTSGLFGHAFRYQSGVMTDLGTLGGQNSEALGINESGQIVGYSSNSASNPRAFVYDGGVMTDLNSLISPSDPLSGLITLIQANGINDSGQIIALGTGPDGERAYILTPVNNTDVPEPSSLALLGFGLCFLLWRSHSKPGELHQR